MRDRNNTVDYMRFIAIIAVISIHVTSVTIPVLEATDTYYFVNIILNQISRFAVPFFFCLSGFYWGTKVRSGSIGAWSLSVSSSKKLLYLFSVWSLIYLLPYNFSTIGELGVMGPLKYAYWGWMHHIDNPYLFLLQGSKLHLWFFISLIMTQLLTGALVRYGILLILLSIFLFVLAVLSKVYANSPIGIELGFNTRNGPFFSTIFFVSGYYLSKYTVRKSWLIYGGFALLLGVALHFTEIFFLYYNYGASLTDDFVFGTYFMGLGFTLLAISSPSFIGCNKVFIWLGRNSLALFLVHFIFVDLLLNSLTSRHLIAELFLYILLVLLASIFSTLLIVRSAFFKKYLLAQ
jgi:surface polysaccharide O-acyltransferase-like enzyme